MSDLNLILLIVGVISALFILIAILREILHNEHNELKPENALEELESTGLDAFAYDTELNISSKRVQEVLMKLNIDSPRKLATLTTDKLLAVKGCGPKTVEEIKVLAEGFDIFIH